MSVDGEAAAGAGYEDQQITCKDCSTEFTFTARAQAYFVEQGFPLSACVRCTWCKEQKRQKSAAKDAEQSGWADEGAGDAQGGEEGGGKKKKKKKKKEAEPSEASASWWDSMVEKNKDKTRCFNCGKKGHTSTDCPKEKGSITGCYRCGSAEHRSRDCPMAVAAADAAKDRCFNCGASGHQAAECTAARGNSACYLCGKDGHQARYCRSAAAQAPKVDADKVSELVAKRTELRAAGDYAGADAIRKQVNRMAQTRPFQTQARPLLTQEHPPVVIAGPGEAIL